MLKTIDHLFHFTKDINSIQQILKDGFKPSYAKEKIVDRNVAIAMVSFSNILLRDTGDEEVLFYGDYAISFNREWGIDNEVNPVVYSYEKGILDNALSTFLYNTILLQGMSQFKDKFKTFTENKFGKFSEHIHVTNTPKEVLDIYDYLSQKYDGELVDIISTHAKVIYKTNFSVLSLTKPFKVQNAEGKEFIAYNDREWRKLYSVLPVLFDDDEEYEKWNNTKKPHFHQDEHRLNFDVKDVRAILVKGEDEIAGIQDFLKSMRDPHWVEHSLANNQLIIGTKQQLIDRGF